MRPIHCICLLLVVSMVASSCVSRQVTTSPVETETQPPLPTPTLSTPRPTSTPQPTSTATLTPPVTLEPEQAKEIISRLLSEPVDCSSPCFWGVTPGETTFGEAKNIFTRFGFQLQGDRHLDYDLESGLSLGISLRVRGDWIVENLVVDIDPGSQNTDIPRKWLAYSPETLISRYGQPSKVEFGLDWGPRSLFSMTMYFDSVDLVILYLVYGYVAPMGSDHSTQVCPLTAPFQARMYMGKNFLYPPRSGVPLEKATSMTLEQFSKLMTTTKDKACFMLKGDAFR